MGKGTDQLRTIGETDETWVGDVNLHAKKPWVRSAREVEELQSYSCNTSNPSYGGLIIIEEDKRSQHVMAHTLEFTRGAVSGLTYGTSPSFAAFNDFEAYSSIDKIELKYGNDIVWETTGEKMFLEYSTYSPEIRAGIAQLQFGNKSLAERQAIAVSTATQDTKWRCPIPVPWTEIMNSLPIFAIANKLRWEITLKPLDKCLNYNLGSGGSGSPSCTIVSTGVNMIVECDHMLDKQKKETFDETQQGLGTLIKGYSFETQLRESVTANTTGQVRVNLTNLKNYTYVLHFWIRTQSQVDSAASRDLWNFVEFTGQYWLQDGNEVITDKYSYSHINDKGNGYYKFRDMYPDSLRTHIYRLPLTSAKLVKASRSGGFGGRNFQAINYPVLYLDYTTATTNSVGASALYIDVFAEIHNVWIVRNGALRRLIA